MPNISFCAVLKSAYTNGSQTCFQLQETFLLTNTMVKNVIECFQNIVIFLLIYSLNFSQILGV